MAKTKQAKTRFPAIPFSGTGAKLTTGQLSRVEYLLDLPPTCVEYLLWRNGGVPQYHHFDWYPTAKRKKTSRIDSLFGIDCRQSIDAVNRRLDIPWAICRFRHWLPRWSVPLGFVDEDWFLITFTSYDDRAGEIWLKEWCHDVPDDSIDPNKKIHFVSKSFSDFVSSWYKSEDDDDD
jgi:hypothetical protein